MQTKRHEAAIGNILVHKEDQLPWQTDAQHKQLLRNKDARKDHQRHAGEKNQIGCKEQPFSDTSRTGSDTGNQTFCHAAVQKNMNDEQRADADSGGLVKKSRPHQRQTSVPDKRCTLQHRSAIS